MVDSDEQKIIQDSLSAIVEFFGGIPTEGKVEFWSMLAEKLSKVVLKEKPWDWRYPKQVSDGSTKPSPIFGKAVEVLSAALDGVPTIVGYTVQVRVFARPGLVKEGSVILGQSKTCARLGCRVTFVPNVPWRRFCSDECCELASKKRTI